MADWFIPRMESEITYRAMELLANVLFGQFTYNTYKCTVFLS